MIEEQPAEPPEEEQPAKRHGSFWRELPILLAVAIVVALVVRTFVLQTFYIPSVSMEHTLEVYDRVLVNKLVYDFRDPRRGEIVVFDAPPAWSGKPDGEAFIKRVIAIGGDRVVCCDEQQRLVINGHSLDEPYLYTEAGVTDPASAFEFDVVVPEGRLWLLGDHRSSSGDSIDHLQRTGGDVMVATIDQQAVVGRAFVLFWPLGRATWLAAPDTFDPVPASPPVRSSSTGPGD